MGTMTGMFVVTAATTLLLATSFSLPSLHQFVPNPARPNECAHCGRRPEVHQPRGNQ